MDPSKFLDEGLKYSNSFSNEPYISPLHEALRGTTVYENMVAHVSSPLPSPPALHGEPFVSPTPISPMPDGYMAPFLYSPATLPVPASPAGVAASEADNVTPSLPQTPPALFQGSDYMRAPVSAYLTDSDIMQILSLPEHRPVMSLLRGDPVSVLQAHLSAIGAADRGPIFQAPMHFTPDVGVAQLAPTFREPTLAAPYMQYNCPLLDQYDPYVASYFGYPLPYPLVSGGQLPLPLPMGQSGGPFDGMKRAAAGYTVTEVGDEREYTCLACNVTFYTAQAFGGHMSHHSKVSKNQVRWKVPRCIPAPSVLPLSVPPPASKRKIPIPRVKNHKLPKAKRTKTKRVKEEKQDDACVAAIEVVAESSAGALKEVNGGEGPSVEN